MPVSTRPARPSDCPRGRWATVRWVTSTSAPASACCRTCLGSAVPSTTASFFDNPVLPSTCRGVLERGSRLHLMGLVGPGGIHAVDEHLLAMVDLAARTGLDPDRVAFHAFTDGRDTPPRSADATFGDLEKRFEDGRTWRASAVATTPWTAIGAGRRTELAYRAVVGGQGLAASNRGRGGRCRVRPGRGRRVHHADRHRRADSDGRR